MAPCSGIELVEQPRRRRLRRVAQQCFDRTCAEVCERACVTLHGLSQRDEQRYKSGVLAAYGVLDCLPGVEAIVSGKCGIGIETARRGRRVAVVVPVADHQPTAHGVDVLWTIPRAAARRPIMPTRRSGAHEPSAAANASSSAAVRPSTSKSSADPRTGASASSSTVSGGGSRAVPRPPRRCSSRRRLMVRSVGVGRDLAIWLNRTRRGAPRGVRRSPRRRERGDSIPRFSRASREFPAPAAAHLLPSVVNECDLTRRDRSRAFAPDGHPQWFL